MSYSSLEKRREWKRKYYTRNLGRRRYANNREKIRKKQRKHREKYPEKWRGYHLFKSYGLISEDYWSMFKAQEGKCAVCHRSPKKYRLSVDHIHVRGFHMLLPEEKRKYIRGLLCYRCNRLVIGANSREILLCGAEYLSRKKALGL